MDCRFFAHSLALRFAHVAQMEFFSQPFGHHISKGEASASGEGGRAGNAVSPRLNTQLSAQPRDAQEIARNVEGSAGHGASATQRGALSRPCRPNSSRNLDRPCVLWGTSLRKIRKLSGQGRLQNCLQSRPRWSHLSTSQIQQPNSCKAYRKASIH